MPELPEVETIVRDLKKALPGLKIISVWSDWPKMLKEPQKNLEAFKKEVVGKKIISVGRNGKNILIYLGDDKLLLIHQKMTGHLLIGQWERKGAKWVSREAGPLREKVNDYIHLIFGLSNDTMLALSDLRKFAKVMAGPAAVIKKTPDLAELGPDPLAKDFTFKKFYDLLKAERGRIKQVLMDQAVISGIGNIYSDEILWQAKIHPLEPIEKLSVNDFKNIYQAARQILKKAVELRGTSTSDYRDTRGQKGGYTFVRKVYRREGEKCSRCGTTIKRLKIGGRSAHYCPQEQKSN